MDGPSGPSVREEMGKWVVQYLPVERLVPKLYARWRPLVRDAMLFMLTHLSAPRLAPKLVEQMDLPADTPPEVRLLRLIAMVPGLQKLGQVLARNPHLRGSLRKALSELENGICDVNAEQIRAIIFEELGARLKSAAVEVDSAIFCEASVSAVVRFTWYNPELQRRERGVFKVMKPYIPACFAEDMELLARLATHLGSKHRDYDFARHVMPDTFNDVRRLLQHEVDFAREQATLLEAGRFYQSVPGVLVPRLIRPLCTPTITAMTEQHGTKITDAVSRMPAWRRVQVSTQLIETLIAAPLFAPHGDVMFHADPHAGNLLYDKRSGELVVLDWALTEYLSRDQRRQLAMLFLMMALRDPVGVSNAIQGLSRTGRRRKHSQQRVIREHVTRFLDRLPITHFPGAVDAMDLLEDIAWKGIRLPAPLVLFRKVLFTLDGILHDIAAPDLTMESVIARHIVQSWLTDLRTFGAPLARRDWVLVQLSALLYGGRLWVQVAQKALDRYSPARPRT
ncbi:MAG TPA: AarF/UbiB family protein [Terriglobales bacterium]|nr:AarF/UbiB family protein [Terriglobales bacterium]